MTEHLARGHTSPPIGNGTCALLTQIMAALGDTYDVQGRASLVCGMLRTLLGESSDATDNDADVIAGLLRDTLAITAPVATSALAVVPDGMGGTGVPVTCR